MNGRRRAGLLLALALAAPAAPAGSERGGAVDETFELDRDTKEYTFDLSVPEGAASARLRIRARVRRGRISWTLIDADGERRFSGRGIRGSIEGDTGAMEQPPPGDWQLVLETYGADGTVAFSWRVE